MLLQPSSTQISKRLSIYDFSLQENTIGMPRLGMLTIKVERGLGGRFELEI